MREMEPLEIFEKYPEYVAKYPEMCFLSQSWKAQTRKIPKKNFMFGMSLLLAHLPSIYQGGYVWLYRGMSKAEAAQIANGLYRDISFFWTPIRLYAANYSPIVCAIRTPAAHIKREYKSMAEFNIVAFAALADATEIRFYYAYGSMLLNKCCNLLIFKRLSEKIFGNNRPKLYLRLAKRKVMKYEI